ncbi:MAG: hypothetical protein WAP35_00115, partial [Solirubrobacterales bacterium]
MSFAYNPGGSDGSAGDDLRRLAIDYPAGLVGNPNAIPSASRCGVSYTGVTASSGSPDYSACPPSSVVGSITVNVDARATVLLLAVDCNLTLTGSIYLLRNQPAADPEVPTHLGVHVSGSAGGLCTIGGTAEMDMTARITLRPNDTGLRIHIIDDLPETAPTDAGTAQIRINSISQTINATTPGGQAFLKTPTRCDAWQTSIYGRAWGSNTNTDATVDGVDYKQASSSIAAPNCSSLAAFNPGFALTQTSTQAGQPTGLTATLTNSIATPQPAHVKRVDVALPLGFQINPAIANGVGSVGCTNAQFAESSPDTPPTCPPETQIGTVSISTPLITGAVTGQVFLGAPGATQAERYRLLIYASNGASVKFEARAIVAANGQVTTVFGDAAAVGKALPQVPWSQFQLVFNSGPQAMISNPQVCGTYSTAATITPWTSPNQAAVIRNANLTATAGPNAAGCAFDAFTPTFSANLSDTGAGKHPNMTLTATRNDRQDNLNSITYRLPNGFTGSVNAVTTPCTAAAAAAGTCAAASQVGTVNVLTGVGAQTAALNGTVHLTDASTSEIAKLAIQVPAIVGPFNLGTTTVYASLVVNSSTTFGLDSITTSMPQMIQGIPVRYRSVALSFNGIVGGRPFLQNPAVCGAGTLDFQATLGSAGEAPASGVSSIVRTDSDQQVSNCTQPFNPTISVTPTTLETVKPTGLNVTVNVPQTTSGVTAATVQSATVRRVQMTMPLGMEINPAFTNSLTACSTANIDAGGGSCAASSEVGTISLVTPLLPTAQSGKIFLETPGGTPTTRYKLGAVIYLPSRTLVLHGTAQVNGSGLGVNSGTGRVTADFDNLPDASFSSFSFIFNSGNRAMFTNPAACASQTFSADLTPSNGAASVNRTAAYTTNYTGTVGSACPGSDPYNPTYAQSVSTTVAGANPNLTMTVTRPDKDQQLRDASFSLPVGLTGAPAAAPTCTQVSADAGSCAANTTIGTITAGVGSGSETLSLPGTIYNTVAPAGQPAKLTAVVPVVAGPFNLGTLSIPVTVALRANLGLDATVANLPQRFEGIPVRYRQLQIVINGRATQGTVSTADDVAFLTNPSKCQVNTTSTSLTSTVPTTVVRTANYSTTGCPTAFNPTVTAAVSTPQTAVPTGLTLGINVPAGHSTLDRVQLTLPAGMEINPAFGNGPLTACSTASIDAGGAACPATSNLGTVALTTPLLSTVQSGSIYLETPGVTAATRYKLAIVIHLPGRDVVIHGSALVGGSSDISTGAGAVDSGTGQVTADFDNIPDLGFTNMTIVFNAGNRALLTNPSTCGAQTVSAALTPNTTGGAVVTRTTTFTTDYN